MFENEDCEEMYLVSISTSHSFDTKTSSDSNTVHLDKVLINFRNKNVKLLKSLKTRSTLRGNDSSISMKEEK